MTKAEDNLNRDMPGITEQLKSAIIKCGACGRPVRRDKSVLVVYCNNDAKTIITHKSCANAIGVDNLIAIYSH